MLTDIFNLDMNAINDDAMVWKITSIAMSEDGKSATLTFNHMFMPLSPRTVRIEEL